MADANRLRMLAAVNTALRLGTILSQFLVNVLVARALVPREAGLYLTYWALATFLAIVGNFGLRTLSVRWISIALVNGRKDVARASLLATSKMSHCAFLGMGLTVAVGFVAVNSTRSELLHFDLSTGALLIIWAVLLGLQYTLSEGFRGFSNHVLSGITGGLLSNLLIILGSPFV